MIGDRIRSYRTEMGLTQVELAKKIGVKPTVVSSWEIGRTEPNLGQCAALAGVFDVTMDELVLTIDPELERILMPLEADIEKPANPSERLLSYALLVSKMTQSQQEEVFNYIDYISKKG